MILSYLILFMWSCASSRSPCGRGEVCMWLIILVKFLYCVITRDVTIQEDYSIVFSHHFAYYHGSFVLLYQEMNESVWKIEHERLTWKRNPLRVNKSCRCTRLSFWICAENNRDITDVQRPFFLWIDVKHSPIRRWVITY